MIVTSGLAVVLACAMGWVKYTRFEQRFAFEALLESSVAASAKVYYDRGAGLSEADSEAAPLHIGSNRISLRLPRGTFTVLRIDPIDREGSVTLTEMRIIAHGRGTVRAISPAELKPNEQISQLDASDDTLRIVTPRGVNDPHLTLLLQPPLVLQWRIHDFLATEGWTLFGWFAASFVALSLLQKIWQRCISVSPGLWALAHDRPRTAIALCSIGAAVLASYPVVFFGKSFVSPNTGTVLLYDHIPMVPGLTDTRPEHIRGADVGAMMWAHLPYTAVQARALREEGTLPLWNRYNSCGVPLLGQGQSMMGDPLNLLVALAGAKTWAFDVKYVLCKALFAGGLGCCVWLLTRALGPALIICFASAFVAFFNYRVNHPAIFSMSYSPWVLVAWLQLVHAAPGRNRAIALILWFIANWMLLHSGTAKESSALLLCLNVTGAALFAFAPISRRSKLQLAAGMALAGLAFALVSAPVWLTFAETLSAARTMYDAPQAFQAPRALLIGLFDDLFYLEMVPHRNVYAPAANFLVLLGCLWAIVQPVRLLRDRAAATILVGLMAAVALGFAWIPASWILEVPFLRNVHQLAIHFSCVAVVLATVLAGWGLAAARTPLSGPRAGRYALVAASVLAAVFYAYFRSNPQFWTGARGFAGWRELAPAHAVAYAHVALLPLALATLTFAAARYVRRQRIPSLLVCACLVALAVVLLRHGQHLSWTGSSSPWIRFPGVRADVSATSPATEFLARETAREPARIAGTGHNVMTGYMSIHAFEGVNGPDALFSPHHRELLDSAQMVPKSDWFVYLAPTSVAAWRPMLDFLNVRYIATAPGTMIDSGEHQRVAALDLDLYRSETTWPRAFFVDRLESYQTVDELVARIRTRVAGRPFAAVQSGDLTAPAPSRDSSGEIEFLPAGDYRLGSNRTAFTITSRRAGYVILHETWWPDSFRVTLDGAPVSYFRVNHAFKGIVLPNAGVHRIEFRYWPRHLSLALGMAAAGLVLLVVAVVIVRHPCTTRDFQLS